MSCPKHIILTLNEKNWCFAPTSLFYNISEYSFHFQIFSLKCLNMTKTFRLNYTIIWSTWLSAMGLLLKVFENCTKWVTTYQVNSKKGSKLDKCWSLIKGESKYKTASWFLIMSFNSIQLTFISLSALKYTHQKKLL